MKQFAYISSIMVVACCFATQDASAQTIQGRASEGVRAIDFANFPFPAWPATGERGTYLFRDGIYKDPPGAQGPPMSRLWFQLKGVAYADVTADRAEEALVVLDWVTGGSALPNVVYVFSTRGGKPVLLWGFTTGDRADGGLKDVFADGGDLVVDLFSPKGKQGDCCPVAYTRTRYRWQHGRFRRVSQSRPMPW